MKKYKIVMIVLAIILWSAAYPPRTNAWTTDEDRKQMPRVQQIESKAHEVDFYLEVCVRYTKPNSKRSLSVDDLTQFLSLRHEVLVQKEHELLDLLEAGPVPPEFAPLPAALKTALQNDVGFDETNSASVQRDYDYWCRRFSAIAEDLAVLDEVGYRIVPEKSASAPSAIVETDRSLSIVADDAVVTNTETLSSEERVQSHAVVPSPADDPQRADSNISIFMKAMWAMLGVVGFSVLVWFIARRSR
jgi:hypothetical protein